MRICISRIPHASSVNEDGAANDFFIQWLRVSRSSDQQLLSADLEVIFQRGNGAVLESADGIDATGVEAQERRDVVGVAIGLDGSRSRAQLKNVLAAAGQFVRCEVP